MLTGFLLVIAIILFGLLTVVSVIFTIIYFVGPRKGKFVWLGIFLVSLLALLGFIYYTTTTVVHKAKVMKERFESGLQKNLEDLTRNAAGSGVDSTYTAYNIPDSLNSKQVLYLKSIEPEKFKGNVPEQFYHYLGFTDYYRLPLVYPFALHCEGSLGAAYLYDERYVVKFDESNNDEEWISTDRVTEFTFDENMLVMKTEINRYAKKEYQHPYGIYTFKTKDYKSFKTLDELIVEARKLGFSKPIKLYGCKEYFDSFGLSK